MKKLQTRQTIKHIENRVCTHLLWGAFTVGVLSLAAPTALAQDCDADEDAVEYDSSDGHTPEETDDWDTTCPGQDGDPNMGVITDGILIVTDNSATAKAKYCAENLFDDSCDRVQDAVYEFSCRALSSVDNAPNWIQHGARFVFASGMSTGTDSDLDYDFGVAITLNEGVGFYTFDVNGDAKWLEVNSVQQHVRIPWNSPDGPWDDKHLFRIEFHNRTSSPTVSLFLDNNPMASLSFAVDELSDNNLDDLTILATTSYEGESSFELMHFRYRIGTTSFDNGPPDCAADFDDDDIVGACDLLQLLKAWGPCTACDEDLDDNGTVGATDLLILLASWGSCP